MKKNWVFVKGALSSLAEFKLGHIVVFLRSSLLESDCDETQRILNVLTLKCHSAIKDYKTRAALPTEASRPAADPS